MNKIDNGQSYNTFRDYLEDLAGRNGLDSDTLDIHQLFSFFVYPSGIGQDSLLDFLVAASKNTTSFVGAAGNFGLEYEMYPAALAEVIGVAATDLEKNHLAFSNYAPYMQAGAWFKVDEPMSDHFGLEIKGTFAYAGTSYAAPIESIVRAIELAQKP